MISSEIEGAKPCWKIGHSRSSSARGRACKNANPYSGELSGGLGNFLGEKVDSNQRRDASQKMHYVGYGKRNFQEKFSSTVFTHSNSESNISKGPCAPYATLVRPNGQVSRPHSTK